MISSNEKIKQLNDKIDRLKLKVEYYENLAASNRPFITYDDHLELKSRKREG